MDSEGILGLGKVGLLGPFRFVDIPRGSGVRCCRFFLGLECTGVKGVWDSFRHPDCSG